MQSTFGENLTPFSLVKVQRTVWSYLRARRGVLKKIKDFGCTHNFYNYLLKVFDSISRPDWPVLYKKTVEVSGYFCECSFFATIDEMFSETLAYVKRPTERKVIIELMTTLIILIANCKGPNSVCNIELAFRMAENVAVYTKHTCSVKLSLLSISNMNALLIIRNYRNKQTLYLQQAAEQLLLLADAFYFTSNSYMLSVCNYHLGLCYFGLSKFCGHDAYASALVYLQHSKNYFSQPKNKQPLAKASISNVISQLMAEISETTGISCVQTQFLHTWSGNGSEYLEKLRISPVKSSEQLQSYTILVQEDLRVSETDIELYIRTSVGSVPEVVLSPICLLEVI